MSKLTLNAYANNPAIRTLELIPHKGVFLTSTGGFGHAVMNFEGMTFDIANFYASRNMAPVGGLYRDGKDVRIRIS